MSDMSHAFGDLFKRFVAKLEAPLAPSGAAEFIKVYEETVGHYLKCDKQNGDTTDYWTKRGFRNWAFASAERMARKVDGNAGENPAESHHVRKGADDAFDEIKADPNQHCNKGQLPPCKHGSPIEILGPVCTYYYQKRAKRKPKRPPRKQPGQRRRPK